MRITPTEIEGVVIIEAPASFADTRGVFREIFRQSEFEEKVCPTLFIQENESHSHYGVIRGLHYQRGEWAQAKLVKVLRGRIFDVAVDMRSFSPTFGKWTGVELTARNRRELFIPRGFAHGFSVLSREAVVQYKCDEYYHKEAEAGVLWNDPKLDIDWRVEPERVVVSAKDSALPPLAEAWTFRM
jgi:dTDP-4-dehydrorhamnose 3,5-epimerase